MPLKTGIISISSLSVSDRLNMIGLRGSWQKQIAGTIINKKDKIIFPGLFMRSWVWGAIRWRRAIAWRMRWGRPIMRPTAHFFHYVTNNIVELFFLSVSANRSNLHEMSISYQFYLLLVIGNKLGYGIR